jgi:hypothetical protein
MHSLVVARDKGGGQAEAGEVVAPPLKALAAAGAVLVTAQVAWTGFEAHLAAHILCFTLLPPRAPSAGGAPQNECIAF